MSTNLKRHESVQEFDAKLSLADFVVGDSDDPLIPPLAFTQWRQAGAWEASIYEPEMLATADARTIINYEGRPRSVINLCSYNYLGLANHPDVISAARDALAKYGLGACGSPLLSGMTDLHRQLERRVAGFLRREDAMLFNSGFGGALGTISGLLRKTDVAILDNRSHLSLRDGAVLSRSRVDRFEHNDLALIVEGIYSMDGDFANLKGLLDMAESHRASVFIDEAHSMLGCGPHGRGAAEHFGVEIRIPLVYGTFSKAFAAVGGFVTGAVETLDYLRYYAHSYAYSCALPPVIVAAALKALDIAESEPQLRVRLWDNAKYFREQLNSIGIDTGNSQRLTSCRLSSAIVRACTNSVTNCAGAVFGSRQWIIRQCRRIEFVSGPV
ncbi:MAG: 8-amino-7-oxononanoate synthase [Verrucomicrobia bacterium]|nr:MAG: 8-amino-7-oxononanoate synthase [Verrucomicrobiota bacterium]